MCLKELQHICDMRILLKPQDVDLDMFVFVIHKNLWTRVPKMTTIFPDPLATEMRQVATATDSTPEACDRKLRLLRSIRETSDNNRIWDIRRDATPVIGTPEAHKSSVN